MLQKIYLITKNPLSAAFGPVLICCWSNSILQTRRLLLVANHTALRATLISSRLCCCHSRNVWRILNGILRTQRSPSRLSLSVGISVNRPSTLPFHFWGRIGQESVSLSTALARRSRDCVPVLSNATWNRTGACPLPPVGQVILLITLLFWLFFGRTQGKSL